MATDAPGRTLETTTRELLETLREIEAAVEPPGPGRFIKPPTPRGLLEFTSEVGIPAAILVLRTNIAALELLQRSLRMMGDRDRREPMPDSSVRDRAASVTATSLGKLDDALDDLGSAIDDRSTDRTSGDLLAEARAQTEQLETQLSAMEGDRRATPGSTTSATEIDVDAELDSLRRSVDTGSDGGDSGGSSEGDPAPGANDGSAATDEDSD